MAGKSRNVNVEVSISGEQKYKQAITELNAANKTLGSELKRLSEEYKGNEESIEYLAQKGEKLQDMLDHQREKVEALQEAVKISAQVHGEASKKTQDLAAQLHSAEASVISLERAIEDNDKAIENLEYSTKGFDENIKMLYSDLSVVDSEMAAGADAAESLEKKDQILNDILAEQAAKLETLNKKMWDMVESGTASEQEINELNLQLNEAKIAYNKTTEAINKNSNELRDNIAEVEEEQEEFVSLGDALSGLTQKFGIQLPSAAKDALNGISFFSAGTVAALGAAAAGITALIEGTKKLYEMTVEYADKADELLTKSMQTGLSTEFLQAYEYAQELVDVPLDTFISSMRKLTDQMDAARDGNKALQETFKDLGVQIIDTTDGSLRPADEVMMETIAALHDMENETERNAAASELFGKSYQSLNPLIVNGTEALEEYMDAAKENYNLTNEEISALAGLDDAVQTNKNEWEGLKQHLSAQFAPAATEALENFTRLVGNAGKALINSGIIEGVGEIFKTLSDMLTPLENLLNTADTAEGRLRPVYEVLHGIAGLLAWIQDIGSAAIGALTYITPAGREKWDTALGYNAQYGQYSHLQQWNGTAAVMEAQLSGYREYGGIDVSNTDVYGYDSATGLYYDKSTGNYIYGNATGNDNWKGGLTWVGENGPELVALPQGSQILSAQESRDIGGDTIYVTIDAKNVKEFNDIVEIAKHAKERMRKR